MSLFSIILTLVISLIVAFVATQNATLVTLHLGNTVLADIPLFFVVLVAIIFGTLIASISTMLSVLKSKWTIFGQKGQLKKSYKTMGEMQQHITDLEQENSTLRDQIKEISTN